MRGRESVVSKRASKQFERRWTSGSASGVADAARGATAGRRRSRTAWELASSAQTTRIVQPWLFWTDDYANAHSCSLLRRVAAMRDVLRAIALYKARLGLFVDSVERVVRRIDKNRTPDAREGRRSAD